MIEASEARAEPVPEDLPGAAPPPDPEAPEGIRPFGPPYRVIRLRGGGGGRSKRKRSESQRTETSGKGLKLDREVFQVSRLMVFTRILTWGFWLLRYALGVLADRVRGRASKKADAVRLRITLERLGASAIKIGQQLGVRADLVPKEISDELLGLLDSVPPFPVAQARALIEKELGRPIDELFETFKDEAIGSASIACVYLATLPTGEEVAVKVRRPGVDRILAADLDAVAYLCRKAESFGLLERGKSLPVLREFRTMLLDELNFGVEARQTELFRLDSKKGNPFVTAPHVYHDYSTNKILVTEFITGISLKHILGAIQRGDEAYLDALAAKGYDLEKLSKRMVDVFYWQLFENTFFHADPHPSNVILLPDNTVVMIDFGATGTITSKYRADLMRFVNSFSKNDLDGMVRNMIASLEPLPPLDIDEYTSDMTHAMREYLFTAKSKSATWQERTSGRAMTAITEISRRYGISMRPDVLRYFRASFQFDSIIYRLNPDLDGRREVRRYFADRARKLQKKQRRRFIRTLTGRRRSDPSGLASLFLTVKSRVQELDNAIAVLAPSVRQLTRLFRRRVSKLAQIALLVVRFVEVLLLAVFVLGLWAYVEQHYPDSSLNHFGDGAIHTLFGHDICLYLRRPENLIHEKGWLWILGSAALGIAIFHRWAGILKTPQSKVEE